MKKRVTLLALVITTIFMVSCKQDKKNNQSTNEDMTQDSTQNESDMQKKVDEYATVKLTTDLSNVSDNQKKMLRKLLKASKIMDTLYWYQTYGNLDSLENSVSDKATKEFIVINYGPWDRLRDNKPFIDGVGKKPLGANFYPQDMTKEEFEKADLKDKEGLYSFVRRNDEGDLYLIPYHEKFKTQLHHAANLLREASGLAKDEGFKKFLSLRADALENDKFQKSDYAWLDMKNNDFDIIIGPIETYEDQLFGYKASYEAHILHKDKDWSERLAKYADFLPELQEKLPVDEKYKQEKPGTDAELNAYDVIYYGGAANAGGKTIAINLPNDEQVQLEKGTRRMQLKNAMRAKFDKILVPIADVLITKDQRQYIDFDAFFANTMFHEVAHGLGIKNTINGKGTVRKALKEHASALEEGKADILGLYMVEQLLDKGELDGDIKNYYVTFIASIFRSVRFGAGDAHGVANMVRFNYFKDKGAFKRLDDGTYQVDFDKTKQAVHDLSNLILTLQGNGDYDGVNKLVETQGKIEPQLQKDLDRLSDQNIPIDVVFEQGADVLGL